MKNRYLLSALALGLGLTAVLMLPLARPIPVACADPAVYYVRAGGTGTTCILTDPCGSVQDAINLVGDGDEVWVATGTYVENLVITRGLSLRGGWDASFAVQAPATYPTTIDGSGDHVISATVEAGSALIEAFTIRDGRDGIHLYTGTITVARNTVRDASRQGIEIEDGHILLEDNLFTDIEREGIEIDGGTVTVLSNTVDGVGRHGILVEGGDITIEGNLIRNVQGEDYHGIQIEVSGVVTGNEIFNIGDRGIEARGDAVVIVNNTVRDTGGDGIRTGATSTNVEIRGNTISNIGNDGIDARGVMVTVASNTVSGCADNGIKSEGASHTFINANQVYGDGDAGIDLDNAGTFTVTNNVVADSSVASVLIQNGAGLHNFLYHNTLVGSATGQQGTGISVTVPGVTINLVNNIVVSHSIGITATPGATLIVSHTLLWGNGSDPINDATVSPAPPQFVAPAQQNYHLLLDSPAIDAGTDAGVTSDMDGDPRAIGTFPDIGADETGLIVIKQAAPDPVQPGAPLTYTIHVTNTCHVTLTATITDVLPEHVTPSGTRTWTPVTITPGSDWTQTVVVTIETDYAGPLTNVVQVTTDEGATGLYTHTLAPDLDVTKQANPGVVQPGEQLTYTICVTNTGNFNLHATITDTLPDHVTPTGTRTWATSIGAPGGIWTQTIVVTVEMDYTGPLTNEVQVTTDEGATGIYTETSSAGYSIYLPLVLRNY